MARQADRRAATTAAIMAAARALFRTDGYDAVSIDHIAARAGCTKGAVYHHFPAKSAIFDRLVDDIQAELAAGLAARAPGAEPPGSPEAMAGAICAYLAGAAAPDVRRILLIDGPVVLGWRRWREIDDTHFAAMVGGGVTRLMGPDTAAPDIEAATRLVLGAVMEAALAIGADPPSGQDAESFRPALIRLFSGLRLGG